MGDWMHLQGSDQFKIDKLRQKVKKKLIKKL